MTKKIHIKDLPSFDMAEHLPDEQAVAEYLSIVLEENDAAALTDALGTVARARSMAQLAKDTGLSRESLYRSLSEGGNPSFATVLKVMNALGLQMHATPLKTASQA